MGWGCPDHPRQRLMYKTHDNKNTKSIKIQCIWIKKLKLKNWSLSHENPTHINSVWTERPLLHLFLDQAKVRSKLSLLKLKCSPSFQNASFAEKLYIKKRNTKNVIIFHRLDHDMVPVEYWATSAVLDNEKTMNLFYISSAVCLKSPEMICSELGLILYRKIIIWNSRFGWIRVLT